MAQKRGKKKAAKKVRTRASKTDKIAKLRAFIRRHGSKFLTDPNITSVGIGYKVTKGETTGDLSIQFTVKDKPEQTGSTLEELDTNEIPKTLIVGGEKIPTDVLQRDYRPGFEIVTAEGLSDRRRRIDPLVPGVSVSNKSGTAGTIGLIVFDNATGAPCMLSNWHVLDGGQGGIGQEIVQPGPFDDNQVDRNVAGRLLRSHLGVAGDCAVAQINERGFDPTVLDLGVQPKQLARPELGDIVIKSGRTTGVTTGVIRRIDVTARIDYAVGPREIGCFEIGLQEGADPNQEVSMGGDSGSAWLIARGGRASDIFVGLHFGGEAGGSADEHALACVAPTVLRKLDVSLLRPADDPPVEEALTGRVGFDVNFLTNDRVPLPTLSAAQRRDAAKLNESPVIPYTHFSVCLSSARRLPRFVAWNIDGSRLQKLSRTGINFKFDPRIDESLQAGEELYRDNPLDRGHVARRADLVWGLAKEAKQANVDSFFFTNITPQHQSFNQSMRGGLWGELEDAIFEDVDVEDLKISVLGGPVFRSRDPSHRGFKVPRDFWKLIAFRDQEGFKVSVYLLTQRDLIADLEALELDPFRVFQISVERLEQETGLKFGRLKQADTFRSGVESEGAERIRLTQAREIRGRRDLVV